MLAFFMGIILTNLVLFLVLSQPFAFENALWLALVSVSLTGIAHHFFQWTLQRTTHLLLAQTYVLLLYSIWVTGGLFSSSAMWMMILPVPAIFFAGLATVIALDRIGATHAVGAGAFDPARLVTGELCVWSAPCVVVTG